jgi:hypothetical protein
MNTMKQLFDGVIEVTDQREMSVQLPGTNPAPDTL